VLLHHSVLGSVLVAIALLTAWQMSRELSRERRDLL